MFLPTKRTSFEGNIGAGRRIRTDDRLITNQVLYQLSYTGDSGEKLSRRDRQGKP